MAKHYYRWPIPGGTVTLSFDCEVGSEEIEMVQQYLNVVKLAMSHACPMPQRAAEMSLPHPGPYPDGAEPPKHPYPGGVGAQPEEESRG